jgi:hypothetical protein
MQANETKKYLYKDKFDKYVTEQGYINKELQKGQHENDDAIDILKIRANINFVITFSIIGMIIYILLSK